MPYYDQAKDENRPWHESIRDHFNSQCADSRGKGDCDNKVKVMDVYAWTAPEGERDLNGDARERVKIGEIRLLSQLITSKAGDERLYFMHNHMKRDRRVWPDEWLDANTDFMGPGGRRGKATFDGIDGKSRKGRHWPWETKDYEAAKEMYQALENSGCPFSWLF